MNATVNSLTPRQAAAVPYVRAWLYIVAFLVFCMVIVGGATRLTDSGLSITEWQPLLGAIPPLTEAAWLDAFEKYKQIPEYQLVNKGMTLSEFEFIYWWEWSHRFLGRFIGVAVFLPLVGFIAMGMMTFRTALRCAALIVLGGLQGALGWYMVSSGLVDRVDVSQYRLSAHLTLATIIFAVTLWIAFGLERRRRAPEEGRQWMALFIVGLIVFQVAAGGFVAGLDAGMGYNTWPLMDGQLVPKGLFVMEPAWRNLFENAMTVQFNHRLIAYIVATCVLGYAYVVQTRQAGFMALAVLGQIALGIWTLLWQVPLWLGLAHQGGALVLLAFALWNLDAELSRKPRYAMGQAVKA